MAEQHATDAVARLRTAIADRYGSSGSWGRVIWVASAEKLQK